MDLQPKSSKKYSGRTKHCCYGVCRSDSRYTDKDDMKDVFFIPFPKPKTNEMKCKKWISACGREYFTMDRVKNWTYVCSKHFVGGKGPTEENPDPIPATYTPLQKYSRKRKAPTSRSTPAQKKTLFEVSETLLQLQNTPANSAANEISNEQHLEIQNPQNDEGNPITVQSDGLAGQETVDLISTTDTKGTQTQYTCSDQFFNKTEKRINHNTSLVARRPKNKRNRHLNETFMSNEQLQTDAKSFKFHTGITIHQFQHLFKSLGDTDYKLKSRMGSNKKAKALKQITHENQLLLTLMKLRHNFPKKDLAFRFGVKASTVSRIFITWIQLLYKMTEPLWRTMFP